MKVDIFNTDKKYQIIYADPPWSYRDKALAGDRGAGCKYDVMSIEDIKKLPVKELAEDDAVLFMWVTMPMLEEAFAVMRAWGFNYKTCAFTWVKHVDDFVGYNTQEHCETIRSFINDCQPFEDRNKIELILPTKNGMHLITRPFDVKTFNSCMGVFTDWIPSPEIKKNHLTLLFEDL